MGKVETGSVALPAIMRSGAGGPESFQMGSMPQAKQHITSGQMHRGHMPPLVSRLHLASPPTHFQAMKMNCETELKVYTLENELKLEYKLESSN